MENLARSWRSDLQESRYFFFRLGCARYAIDLTFIRECHCVENLVVLPGMPALVRGVFSHEGRMIPVLDSARRFGQTPGENSGCIVVVTFRGQAAGLEVDRVEDGTEAPLDPLSDSESQGGGWIFRQEEEGEKYKPFMDVEEFLFGDEEEPVRAFVEDWKVL